MLKKSQTDNVIQPKEETKNAPTSEILDAFGVTGEPTLLTGGQGTCYRVDDTVFKPAQNTLEASWIAKINNGLMSNKFRVPKFFQAKDGSWVFQNWTASEFLVGEHRSGHYTEAIEVSGVFHEALKNIPKPDWFDNKTDVFSLSDKMAWGELPLPNFEPSREPFQKIFRLLKKNRLPNQLVHGDWGVGQILFHETLPPAVIDMTPYFRPADYPIADMIVCTLANSTDIVDLGKDIKNFDQLLLRALLFRTLTYIGFQIHPKNDRDWTPTIRNYLSLVDPIIKKIT